MWEELERESGQVLMITTGGLMVGERDGVLVSGALRSAVEHRLPYEEIDAREMRRRFPCFIPDERMVGIWEPRAGVLFPERCIAAYLERARVSGAVIHTHEPVERWCPDGQGVRVETSRGSYRAEQLILSAGAWCPGLLLDLGSTLAVERMVLLWFEPIGNPDLFDPGRCPISIWEYAKDRFFYGFPRLDDGIKLARHHEGEITTPDRIRRRVEEAEVDPLRNLALRYMPEAAGKLNRSAVCMYTNTPDGHFIIDRHPEHRQVLIVSACSGHGFKFAPTIGEIASDLMVEGWTRHDLGLFGIGRFAMS